MKKIKCIVALSTILFSGMLTNTHGDDICWVLISPKDNFSIYAEEDKGKSKKGDVVAIMSCSSQNEPTEAEKSRYIILKVSGITDVIKEMLEEPYVDSEGEILAYRKYKVDIDQLSLSVPGIVDGVKVYSEYLASNIKAKTVDDLIQYNEDRLEYAEENPDN